MSIFHLKHPRKKHEENSIRGVKEAVRKHFTEIDLDLLITKDGHIVCCHWDTPMIHDGFRDPKRKIGSHVKVRDMTLAEVQRLRAGSVFKRYHISTLEELLRECAKRGIGARLEPKDDKRFESVALWKGVASLGKSLHVKLRGYSLRNFASKGAGVRRVDAMNKAGIPAKVIH